MELTERKIGVELSSETSKTKEIKSIEERKQLSKQGLIGVIIVLFSVFLDDLILPFFAEKFNADSAQLGLIYSAYSGMALIATYVMGKMSDKYGRKITILYSLFGTGVGYLLTGFSFNYVSLLCFRMICGAFGASAPISQAYITDVVPKHKLAKYLSLQSGVTALSYIIGPVVGSGLGQFGIRIPFYVSGGIGFVGLIFALVYLKEPEKKEIKKDEIISSKIELRIYYLFIIYFLSFIGRNVMTTMIALYALDTYNVGSLEIGFSFLVTALMIVITTIFIFNYIKNKMDTYYISILGFLLQGIGLICCVLHKNIWYFLSFVVILVGIGNGLIMPTRHVIFYSFTNPTNKGKILAFGNTASNLANTIGPLCMGLIYGINKKYPFYVGGMLSIISVIGLYLFKWYYFLRYEKEDSIIVKEEKDRKTLEDEDWEYIPEKPIKDDYLKLGIWVGKLLTKRNYLWVNNFDVLQEWFRNLLIPVRINSRETYKEDVQYIRESIMNMQQDWKLLKYDVDFNFDVI